MKVDPKARVAGWAAFIHPKTPRRHETRKAAVGLSLLESTDGASVTAETIKQCWEAGLMVYPIHYTLN